MYRCFKEYCFYYKKTPSRHCEERSDEAISVCGVCGLIYGIVLRCFPTHLPALRYAPLHLQIASDSYSNTWISLIP